MPDLHPEVLKEIEAGRKTVIAPEHSGMELIEPIETPEEFARRIAALAVEKEREGCAKVCEEMIAFDLDDPGKSAAAAIRRRGKP